MKNEGVVRVLAVLFPGTAQLYLGDWLRGILFVLLWVWFFFIKAVPDIVLYTTGLLDGALMFKGLIIPIVLWVLNILSAFGDLKALREKKSTQQQAAH